MNDWNQVFLGIIAAATALMALMQIGAIVVLARVAGAGPGRSSRRCSSDIRPLHRARDTRSPTRRQKTATLATAQAQKIDRLVTDLTRRVDETSAVIQQAIITPAREGHGDLRGPQGRTRRPARLPRPRAAAPAAVDDEDALFIG